MKPVEGLIFDLDGVLLDTAQHHYTAWRRLADELGISFLPKDNEKLKGLSRVESLERILSMGGLMLNNDTKLQLMERKNAWYIELIADMTSEDVLPGVRAFIESSRKAGLHIALGSSSNNATTILQRCNLETLFDAIIDGRHVTHTKPDPEVFLKGAAQMNLSPSQVAVFEDAQAGIEAALAGGFHAVGVGLPSNLPGAAWVIPGFVGLTLEGLHQALALQASG
ncbi:MAG: beta-phosphoglucomutase [Flavobacteriales bacterium]|nr:beta-phosphoglucomutase [Flavobacteriales bacterium]